MPDLQRIDFESPQHNYFQLAFFGGDADKNRVDMYDASASFYGFSRTIAILGHYYSTGKVNAHAPKSEVSVFLETSEDGSFKQTVMAAAVSAVVSTPLAVFITRAMDTWIPAPDSETQQIIDLLKEQNELLKRQSSSSTTPEQSAEKMKQEVKKADEFITSNRDQLDVLRSVTANSFKDIFRPVGKSVGIVGITSGETRFPIGAVNPRALSLIEADRPDEEYIFIVGVVNSFSRSSKSGVMFAPDLGRGFRFEFRTSKKLPPEDDFSWSQYYQRPIRVSGRFVRFFDGKIKKFLADHVERVDHLIN